jgi:hypothetical protein
VTAEERPIIGFCWNNEENLELTTNNLSELAGDTTRRDSSMNKGRRGQLAH